MSNNSNNKWRVGICLGIIGGMGVGISVEQGAWIRKGVGLEIGAEIEILL